MKTAIKFITILFFTMLILGSCKTHTLNVTVASSVPPKFIEVMKGGNRIAVFSKKDKRNNTDWKHQLEGAIKNELNHAGYFTIVDVASRKDRLEAIAFSNSGMTAEAKEIGKEMSVDGFLYLTTASEPKTECTRESREVKKEVCVAKDKEGKCTKTNIKYETKWTSTLLVNVYMEGILVNLETGRTLGHAITETQKFRKSQKDCPSELEAIEKATEKGAEELVSRISPVMTQMEIEVFNDTDANIPNKDQINHRLDEGAKALANDEPDYLSIISVWEDAARLADEKAPEPYWNLGIAYWKMLRMNQAEENFSKALNLGGRDFRDDQKIMNVYRTFEMEKSRMEKMGLL